MLSIQKMKLSQKVVSTNNESSTLNTIETLEIIEKVTGLKVKVLSVAGSANLSQKAIQNNDSTSNINLDVDQFQLANYTNSLITQKYFKLVDCILQDESFSVAEKIEKINVIQDDLFKERNISTVDAQNFMNGTEVLKGSLKLWSEEFSENSKVKSSIGRYNSAPCQWSFWKR